MNDWRYSTVTDVNGHTIITRGRMYNVGNSDSWGYYWDGTDIVAFYDEGFRGLRSADWCDEEDGRRATVAYSTEQDNLPGSEGAMKRLAVRLTENPDADFIHVSLDRGTDFYVLSWDGDPSGDWRREIEAVWNGDIYRCEVEEYRDYALPDTENNWIPADDVCEEWYGEDNADAVLVEMFPETEFPAEHMIDHPIGRRTSMIYTVTQTIQSRDLSNPPVAIRMYRGANLAVAVAALATAAVEQDTMEHLPESVRYDTLAVTMTYTKEF